MMDIKCKRKNYDGLYVYDHEDNLLGKVVRYNDNYKLWSICMFVDGDFESPFGMYESEKDALNEIRSMYGYDEVA